MNQKVEMLFAVLLPVLLYMMVYTDNVYFFYIAMLVGLMFIFKPIVLLPMYFVSSLSTNYFALSNGTSVGRYTFVLIFISLIVEFLNNYKKNYNRYIPLILILLLFSFLSATTSITGSYEPFVQMAMNLLFFGLILFYEKLNVNRLYKYISIAYFICLFSIALFIISHGHDLFIERFRDDDETMNSNRLAMMCNQVGVLLFSIFLLSNNFNTKILSMVGYVVALLEIVILGSRSALIALLLASILGFLFFQKANKNVNRKSIRVVFISLLLVGGLLVYYLSSIDSPLMERFSAESVVESKGTNRLNLIEIIMKKIFPEHYLFGVGIGSQNILEAGKPYGLIRPGHNIIIDPLSQLGIIGFSLFLFLLVPLFFKSLKASVESKFSPFILPAFLLFLASILNGIGEIIFYEKFFWNNAALCAFCLLKFNKRHSIYGKV